MALFPKPTTIKDSAYKEWIKSLCCCVTGRQEYDPNTGQRFCDPHHVPKDGEGKMAGKADDRRCIPLLHHLHNEAHNIGKHTFAKKYGLDYELLISQLNKIYDLKGD